MCARACVCLCVRACAIAIARDLIMDVECIDYKVQTAGNISLLRTDTLQ